MAPEKTGPHSMAHDPPIWTDFRKIFQQQKVPVALTPIERFEFYRTVQSPDHVLTIQTADQRLFANLLLTIGVRKD